MWVQASQDLLAGLIGYVLTSHHYEGRRTLRSIVDIVSNGESLQLTLQFIVRQPGLPSFVIIKCNQFIALEPKVRNSVLLNFNNSVKAWSSDLISAVTAKSDFDIRELRRKPMAIFIGCSIAQIETYRTLLRIFVQQIHDLLMINRPSRKDPLELLVMLDEFSQLGRMDSIVSKLSASAGFGFRMVVVLQDVNQLDEIYGIDKRITTLAHCQVKLFIQINDLATSEFVSKTLGYTTCVVHTPVSRAGDGLFSLRSKNIHYHQQPLRSPHELMDMPEDKAILLVKAGAFELKKVRFFKDKPYKRYFERTASWHVPIPSVDWKAFAINLPGSVGENATATPPGNNKGADAAKPDSDKIQIAKAAPNEANSPAAPKPDRGDGNRGKRSSNESTRNGASDKNVDKDEVMTVTTLTASVQGDKPPPSEPTPPQTPHEELDELELGGIVQDNIENVDQTTPSVDQSLRKIDNVAAAKILARFRGLGSSFGEA